MRVANQSGAFLSREPERLTILGVDVSAVNEEIIADCSIMHDSVAPAQGESSTDHMALDVKQVFTPTTDVTSSPFYGSRIRAEHRGSARMSHWYALSLEAWAYHTGAGTGTHRSDVTGLNIDVESDSSSSGKIEGLNSVFAQCYHSGSGEIEYLRGGYWVAGPSGSGAVVGIPNGGRNMYAAGFQVEIDNFSSQVLPEGVGVWVSKPYAIAGITDMYGLLIQDIGDGQGGGVVTNSYGIYFEAQDSAAGNKYALFLADSGAAELASINGDGNIRSKVGLGTKHEAAATPTGGQSGDIRVGNGKIWINDAGTWKSAAVA